MMKTLVCLALLFIAMPCVAQENLEPDDTPGIKGQWLFGRDYGRRLKPEIGKDVRIFAVIEGGLVPDFMVGLKIVRDGYRIFMVGEKRNVGLDRCAAPIDNDLARDIIIAWDKVLRQARVPAHRPMRGADVPFYHFGSNLSSGLVIGRALYASSSSNPAHLGRIAGGLLQICSGGHAQPIPEAMAEIRTALKAIR